MTSSDPKNRTVDELAEIRDKLRADGKVVVQCHGCFDIVHPGHIRYLKFARELGDVLIVSVSADSVVAKGAERPYVGQDLRLENLAALEIVDYVCLDENDWAGPVLDRLRPDIYVKGKEYESKGDARFARELALVEGYGGRVVYSSGDVVYSSTYILSRFREQFPLEMEKLRAFCQRHSIDLDAVHTALREAAGKRVLVVGDAIVDRYIYCDALGVASEQPILSVTPLREETFVGAGALIASQLVALGAEASMLTSFRAGGDGDAFVQETEARGVSVHNVADHGRPAAVKTRYLVDGHKVFKVDSGVVMPPSTEATRRLAARFEELLREHDGMVVTDFGYGMFGNELIEAIVRICQEQGKPYYLDVSHTRRASILRFAGPRIAAPTEQELRFAFADNEAGLSNLATRYFRQTGAERLMLTLGKRGVLLFDAPARPKQRLAASFVPALAPTAIDAIGAGDVFLAGAALADLAGSPAEHGAYLGSCLAALHVSRLGNEPVDNADLRRFLERRPELGGDGAIEPTG